MPPRAGEYCTESDTLLCPGFKYMAVKQQLVVLNDLELFFVGYKNKIPSVSIFSFRMADAKRSAGAFPPKSQWGEGGNSSI